MVEHGGRQGYATKHYHSACQGLGQQSVGAECRLHVLQAGWEESHGWARERAGNRMGFKREKRRAWVCVHNMWVMHVCMWPNIYARVCWIFIRCLSVYTCVYFSVREHVDVYTRSWGQTLTHKWNLATRVPGSLSCGSHGSWSCKPQWSRLNEAW